MRKPGGIILAAAMAAVTTATGCSNQSHATPIRVHGLVAGNGTCPVLVLTGQQVTVTDSGHKVIATGIVGGINRRATSRINQAVGHPGYATAFNFTVSVPGALPRYGIQIAGIPGTEWLPEKTMKAGPVLQCGF